MGIETGTYISSLNALWPLGTDTKATIDDHLRFIKSTVKATFPNVSGAVTPTHTRLNYLASAGGTTGTTSSNLVFSASPVFTGAITTGAGASFAFGTTPASSGDIRGHADFAIGVRNAANSGNINALSMSSDVVYLQDGKFGVSTTGATLTGTFAVSGNLAINTDKFTVAASSGNTVVAGTLGVTGTSTLAAVNASGDFAIATSKFTVASASGNTVVAGTLGVTGTSTLAAIAASGDFAIATNKFTVASASGNTVVAGTIGVTGTATLAAINASGDFAIATNKFTVAAASGNTIVAGTLGVTGAATFSAVDAQATTVTTLRGGANATGAAIIQNAQGSAASPTWSFNNNADLGWYRSGTDAQAWAVGGAKKLELSSSTYAITPAVTMASTLAVSGTLSGQSIETLNSGSLYQYNSGSTTYFRTRNDANNLDVSFNGGAVITRTNSSGLAVTGTLSSTGIATFASGSGIDTSGNPQFLIKTSGAGNNPSLQWQASSNYWTAEAAFSDATDPLKFSYNGATVLSVSSSGLAVTGDGTATGRLVASGGANPSMSAPSAQLSVFGNYPRLHLTDTAAASGGRNAEFARVGTTLYGSFNNDTFTAGTDWLRVVGTSSGITSVLLNGPTSVTGTLSTTDTIASVNAAGTNKYIALSTNGVQNTVMGFNNSGSTDAQGTPNNHSYFGNLNGYPLSFTSNGALLGTWASTEILIKNTTGAPGSNPSGGGYLYVESGALKYRGSSGTVTTIANA